MASPKPAIVLLSGGLDSATVAAMAAAQGFGLHALTFRYGQRHDIEIAAARAVAADLGITRHIVLDIDLRRFGGSALTDDIAVPKGRDIAQMAAEIPITYVPARNTIFLSLALAWAEVVAAKDIFIGVNAVDYSGYPDCRPAFIEAFETLANVATKAAVSDSDKLTIQTPLMDLNKGEIITRGLALGVDYGLTTSCYDPSPGGEACGECDSCGLRLQGFAQAGRRDPRPYLSAPSGAGQGS